MKSAIKRIVIAASLAAAALQGACVRREAVAPVFGLELCRRVELTDRVSGAKIVGAEDLAIDRIGRRLMVSAYNRRAVESGAKAGNDLLPVGGLYSIALEELEGAPESLVVKSTIEATTIAGGLRPHGVSYDESSSVISFINRAYARDNGRWRMTTRLVQTDGDGRILRSENAPNCAANDLASFSGRLYVTLDHGACGWRASAEDIFGLKRARVVDDEGAALLSGIGYANGIVVSPDGRFFVAATREKSIYIFSKSDDGSAAPALVKIGAAPDNLTLSDEGRIIVAVHPSLLRLGLQRRMRIGRSPSRIIELDLESGSQRLLFDDPRAQLVSAATSAVSTEGILIMGSVIDPGVIVCRNLSAIR